MIPVTRSTEMTVPVTDMIMPCFACPLNSFSLPLDTTAKMIPSPPMAGISINPNIAPAKETIPNNIPSPAKKGIVGKQHTIPARDIMPKMKDSLANLPAASCLSLLSSIKYTPEQDPGAIPASYTHSLVNHIISRL